jgi:hypothetical protein
VERLREYGAGLPSPDTSAILVMYIVMYTGAYTICADGPHVGSHVPSTPKTPSGILGAPHLHEVESLRELSAIGINRG